VEIRLITDNEFIQLVELNAEMYAGINPDINEYRATEMLMTLIRSTEEFMSIGMFEENVLIGFVSGYKFSPTSFLFTGLYVVHKNSDWTKQLIEYCFDLIEAKGYTRWEVDATNENIASIVKKYGAEPKYTRYVKEIANG
jgi:hypothetical protein